MKKDIFNSRYMVWIGFLMNLISRTRVLKKCTWVNLLSNKSTYSWSFFAYFEKSHYFQTKNWRKVIEDNTQ